MADEEDSQRMYNILHLEVQTVYSFGLMSHVLRHQRPFLQLQHFRPRRSNREYGHIKS